MQYVHLTSECALPTWTPTAPFKAVVVIDEVVDKTWQYRVSTWLVHSGCFYMMAWGMDCSSWDDSVDWANLERFHYDVPNDQHVMTTWHSNDTLAEVFWFCEHCARHDHLEHPETYVIDITKHSRRDEMLELYRSAQHREAEKKSV